MPYKGFQDYQGYFEHTVFLRLKKSFSQGLVLRRQLAIHIYYELATQLSLCLYLAIQLATASYKPRLKQFMKFILSNDSIKYRVVTALSIYQHNRQKCSINVTIICEQAREKQSYLHKMYLFVLTWNLSSILQLAMCYIKSVRFPEFLTEYWIYIQYDNLFTLLI